MSAQQFQSQEFDLNCAVVSAVELGLNAVGSEQYQAALCIELFYLGRLSARDDTVMWSDKVKARIADQQKKARSPEAYARCIQFVTAKL